MENTFSLKGQVPLNVIQDSFRPNFNEEGCFQYLTSLSDQIRLKVRKYTEITFPNSLLRCLLEGMDLIMTYNLKWFVHV